MKKDETYRQNEKRLSALYDKLEYHTNKLNYLNVEIAKLEILIENEKNGKVEEVEND